MNYRGKKYEPTQKEENYLPREMTYRGRQTTDEGNRGGVKIQSGGKRHDSWDGKMLYKEREVRTTREKMNGRGRER